MIVLCDGMQRSGSTWAFNVSVKLLQQAWPGAAVCGLFNDRFAEVLATVGPTYDHLVVKSHVLDDTARRLVRLGAAKTIYTHRDSYDAIASYMQMFGRPFEEALHAISDSLDLLNFHRAGSGCHIVSYESLRCRGKQEVAAVAAFLGVLAGPEVIEEVHRATCFESMRQTADRLAEAPQDSLVRFADLAYDGQTLLHPHHVRDGGSGYGRRLLTPDQQARIAQMLRKGA